MAGQQLISSRDVVKFPQFVVEGTTATTYAITPTNPAFSPVGRDATLIESPTPTKDNLRIGGKLDRQRSDLIREVNTVTLAFKLVETDFALLKWLTNLPNGAGTPDESRTFFWSYKNNAGTEIFQVFKGCHVDTYTLTVDNLGYITVTCNMMCKTITTVTPTIGTGSFATPNVTAPLNNKDAGLEPFTYNSTVTEIENFSITVAFVYGMQDSIGSSTKLFARPTQRTITGSAVIYKKDDTLQSDARTVINNTAIFKLKGSVTTQIFTFTRFLWMPSGEDMGGDTPDATMENKSWEADEVVLA